MTMMTRRIGYTERKTQVGCSCRNKTNRSARERLVRLYLIAAVFAVGFFLLLTLMHGQMARASASHETVREYRSVEVKAGDTLWEIAKEYGNGHNPDSYVKEIKQINHLNDDVIHAGAYLTIPYEAIAKR